MSMSSTTTATTGPTGSSSAGEESAVQHGTNVVKEHAGAAAATAKQEAASVVSAATDHARSLLGSAGDELRQQSRSQADRMGELLGQASQDFGRMADECDTRSPAGRTVQTLADATGELARRLEQGGPEGVVTDVGRFARRRPGVFLALSAAAGFAVGRLARSTDTTAVKDAVQSSGATGSSNGSAVTASSSTIGGPPPTGGQALSGGAASGAVYGATEGATDLSPGTPTMSAAPDEPLAAGGSGTATLGDLSGGDPR